MIVWIAGIAGIILQILCAAASGTGLVVGFIFFLIGFGGMKRENQTLIKLWLSKDTMMIMGTMLVVLIFFLIAYWNVRLMGDAMFPGLLGSAVRDISGKQLLIAGIASACWTLLMLYWLLPIVFNFKGLGLKPQLIALSASAFSIVFAALHMD